MFFSHCHESDLTLQWLRKMSIMVLLLLLLGSGNYNAGIWKLELPFATRSYRRPNIFLGGIHFRVFKEFLAISAALLFVWLVGTTTLEIIDFKFYVVSQVIYEDRPYGLTVL